MRRVCATFDTHDAVRILDGRRALHRAEANGTGPRLHVRIPSDDVGDDITEASSRGEGRHPVYAQVAHPALGHGISEFTLAMNESEARRCTQRGATWQFDRHQDRSVTFAWSSESLPRLPKIDGEDAVDEVHGRICCSLDVCSPLTIAWHNRHCGVSAVAGIDSNVAAGDVNHGVDRCGCVEGFHDYS